MANGSITTTAGAKSRYMTPHATSCCAVANSWSRPACVVADQGHSLQPLIKIAQQHFATSTDRVEVHAELNQWLARVSDLIASRVADIDRSITETRATAAECKKELQAATAACEADPKFRTVPFVLSSALFAHDDALWTYVRHDSKWWLVQEGTASEVAWETVAGDSRGAASSQGVYMLVYERGKNMQGSAPEQSGAETPLIEL